MSDGSDKGSTLPMNAKARPATQVSASAVPSTLESPAEPGKLDATVRMDGSPEGDAAAGSQGEEISAQVVAHEAALRHGGATAPVARRGPPSTKMSPAVDPAAFKVAGPDPKPEEAVTIAPAFPIVDHAAAARGGTFQTGGQYDAHGQYSGPPPPQAARRSGMSGLTIALIIGGIVLLLAAIGVGIFAFVFVRAAHERIETPPTVVTVAAPATTTAPTTPPVVATPPPPPEPPPHPTTVPTLTPPPKKHPAQHDR